MTLGKRISQLRADRKISQEYLAERLNVSRQAVSKWENDLSSPGTQNLIQLSELFGVSLAYLATGKESGQAALPSGNTKLPKALKKLSLFFFLIAFASHCIGLFSGEFTKPLIPFFPYLWYGKSTFAIILNVFTVLFTIGWISLLYVTFSTGKKGTDREKT